MTLTPPVERDPDRAKRIVIKVGSAVISGHDALNPGVIDSLASQIADIAQADRSIVLVSSGAVAAGKAILKKDGIKDFPNYATARHGIAAVGQSSLMAAWSKAFAPYRMITAQVLLTRDDLRSRARFQTAAATFAEILSWRAVPVVNENDTVSANDLRFGDNDCLASLLVNLVEADLFINLTSAPGVLDANPEDNPNARVMSRIGNIGDIDIEALCGAKTELGSGGMKSKLLAARRVAQLGVPTLILPGRESNVLRRAFSGAEIIGTWVSPATKAIPRRKFWLAYQSEPAGFVAVDDGAADALLHHGRSLLPGGITRVEGDFQAGALLRVIHDGKNIGVGFSNYSAAELARIKGLKRHEVAAILGLAKYPDVIHRDNLLLDAAI